MTQLQGWNVAGKSWVALIGSLLTFLIPTVVQMSTAWPEPWPAVVGAVVAILTAVGVYHAPYRPLPATPTPQEQAVIEALRARQAADEATQKIKDMMSDAVQDVPVLGPLARQALDRLDIP